MYQTSNRGILIIDYKRVGIGYLVLLAAVLNCHKKHSDYDPVLFSALLVDWVSVTVMYTLNYLRKLL